ncbi:DMT family transporter [Aliiroseovarius sp. YM-037]|uniref:DMT family transporter n=1 Tax=Aliiroseovarius sp. YM-037 TaxID=3341728 RepID=UPI003A7FE046
MQTQPPPPSLTNWVLMLSVALIWGSSFMLVEVALTGFGPISVAAYRVTLAAVLLLTLTFVTGHGLPPVRGPKAGFVWASALGMGIFSNALPFFLLSWGQQYVASGFAGVTMAAVPLLILPLAHIFVPGERMTWLKNAGFILGFAGVLLLIGLEAFQNMGVDREATGRMACLASAMCYATGSIITRLCPAVSKIALAAGTMLLASLLILPLALILEGPPDSVAFLPILAVTTLGIFATAGAKLIQVKVVREAGPSFMALVNYQVPVWSLVIGWAVLNEALPAKFFLALMMIICGMALGQWKSLRSLYRRTTTPVA